MKPTIGIEVHCELKTNSKAFSQSKNTYGEIPNTMINVLDLGYPGTLPVLNKKIIDLGIKAAIVLNCDITRTIYFDRKNYFYPDNPKNYQVTQNSTPIGRNGYVLIEYDGIKKKIEIEEIHIEEDTCKSIHESNHTLLDFNRAGIPLVEIVTKPVISNEKEAVLYLEALREMFLYAGISDVKIEEGSMRCDLNISLSNTEKLGTKVEVKNIGSISNVADSVLYEIKRQEKLLNEGIVLKEETRRWDDKTSSTILMRVKETGNDYRYFPEPDMAYIELTDEEISGTLKSLPILPNQLRNKYKQKGINSNNINTIISNKEICDFFESIFDLTNQVMSANILTSEVLSYINKNKISLNETLLTKENFIKLIELLEKNVITTKHCKEIIPIMLEKGTNVEEIIKDLNIEVITDDNFVLDIINKVINENPNSVKDYKEGKDRAVKYLMGQVMKESKGKINPKDAMDKLISNLNNI